MNFAENVFSYVFAKHKPQFSHVRDPNIIRLPTNLPLRITEVLRKAVLKIRQ